MDRCGILDPFRCSSLPFQEWVGAALRWVVDNYRPAFQTMKTPIDQLLRSFDWLMNAVPPTVMIAAFCLVAWQIGGRRLVVPVAAGLIVIGLIGVWRETMTTLSIILASVTICLVVGIPVGVLAARSEGVYRAIRPVLDVMQTIPAFVYLVPVVMLFGIGNVPGVIVTVIFALPPVVRLTNLGIRQVPEDVVEAMRAFGASDWQLLWKAQLPIAMPTIMAGVNQTLMMSLSMVVVASMIAVGGLGQTVLRGIGRLDMGVAAIGGIGIVILAIVLDRMSQSLAQKRQPRAGQWWRRGPLGFIRSVTGRDAGSRVQGR